VDVLFRTPRPAPMAYDEVTAIGVLAVYEAFGDHLVFIDGTIYALPEGFESYGAVDVSSIVGAVRITSVVGVEYGWRHLRDCACGRCGGHRAVHAA
jgi:hypothetical protein